MTHLDSNRPARLGIVGCGAITREAHLPVIVGDRWVDLAVLCDRDRGNAVYWKSMQPNAHDSVKAAIRLAASPAFHAQLGTIPSLGQLIRSAKEMVPPRIKPEQKLKIKSQLQGRGAPAHVDETPSVRMPSARRSGCGLRG